MHFLIFGYKIKEIQNSHVYYILLGFVCWAFSVHKCQCIICLQLTGDLSAGKGSSSPETLN